ncbi:hypothetical protein MFLAVUS_009176 [Mucor flavus]|uniref:NADH dehydrogenase subunit 9 n=1 Tax=Mucor flavus TaxID=439312 RepID=A0ABP9Z982_9FUNG
MNLFKKSSNRFYSLVSTCYSSVKDTIKSYHTYASSYDAHQSEQYAEESNYDSFFIVDVTQSMDKWVSPDNYPARFITFKNAINSVTSSIVYGMFATISSIRTRKKKLFVQKQPEKEMRGAGVDFSLFSTERDPELTFKMEYARSKHRDSFLLKDEKTDFVWGFVRDDFSVKFESTLLPIKPPRGLFRKTNR